jgi:DNA polymerase-3 subunit beta
MHVVVAKKDLLRILARCQGVADKKGTMPILANVLLQAPAGGPLALSATDLFLAVRGEVPAEVEKKGSVAIGARDLLERVRMMPEGNISIATNDGASTTVRALGQARRFTLNGVPGEEFPALPKADQGTQELELGVKALGQLIAKTHFSISTDDTRLHLNSALFDWKGKAVRMVSTDGHRLSRSEIQVEKSNEASMLIPLKGILELKRLCEEASEGEVLTLRKSGPNAFFDIAGFSLSIKLVEAQFPPYEQVIPQSSEVKVVAPRQAIADALRAVAVAANDRTGGVKLSLSKGAIRFSSESSEGGDGYDEVPVDYSGPEMTIGFSAKYFLDAVGAIETDEIELGLSGELDPAVVSPHGAEGSSFVAVIMPMRI